MYVCKAERGLIEFHAASSGIVRATYRSMESHNSIVRGSHNGRYRVVTSEL